MLIEIRIGPGKQKIASWISSFCERGHIHRSKIHRVPHITLYGSFSVDYHQTRKVQRAIAAIGSRYSFLNFTIDGLRCTKGEKGFVIYFNIVPSKEFRQFRVELARTLHSIVPDTKPFDYLEEFVYHLTLAYKLSNREFEQISASRRRGDQEAKETFAQNFYLPLAALRITVLNDKSRILCEYDLLQQRILSRQDALSKQEWQKTLQLFRLCKGAGQFRAHGSVYLISDLHLDHANIIHYCARPFLSSCVSEMNSVLVHNWKADTTAQPEKNRQVVLPPTDVYSGIHA
jgi:2'-5' RNA ligase